jgi:hypothetical protein
VTTGLSSQEIDLINTINFYLGLEILCSNVSYTSILSSILHYIFVANEIYHSKEM